MDTAVHARRPAWEMACWIGIPVVAIVGFVWVQLQAFGTVGCEGICHDRIIFATLGLFPWLLFGSVVAALVTGLVLAGLDRRTHLVAVSGLVLVVAVVGGSTLLLEVGFQPLRERNARAEQGLLPSTPPADPSGRWSVDGAGASLSLHLSENGTAAAHDGCNPLVGTWQHEPDGVIRLTLSPEATRVCEGVDIWLSHAASAVLTDGRLIIRTDTESAIGVLEVDR